MIHVVFLTFGSTRIAYICTKLAKRIGMIAIQAHELGRCSANGCALHVELNAICHLFHHALFAEAG